MLPSHCWCRCENHIESRFHNLEFVRFWKPWWPMWSRCWRCPSCRCGSAASRSWSSWWWTRCCPQPQARSRTRCEPEIFSFTKQEQIFSHLYNCCKYCVIFSYFLPSQFYKTNYEAASRLGAVSVMDVIDINFNEVADLDVAAGASFKSKTLET